MELLNYNNMTWDDLLKSSSYINATEDRKAAMQNEWLDSFMADFTPEELQLGAQKLTQDILNSTSISQGQVFNALRRAGYVMPTQDAVPKQDTKHFRLDDVIPHFDNKVLEMYRQTGIAALSSYAQILNGLEAIPAAVARAQGIIDTQVLPQNETIWDPKIKRYVTRPNKARQEAGKRYLEYVDNAHDRMEKRIKDAQRMLDENNVNIKVWEHLKQGDFGEAAQGMVNTMAKGLMEHSLQMATAYAVGPLASSALMGVSVEEQKYAELRHSDLPEWQKNTIAILDGTWEFIFEHLSTEQLFRRMQMGEGDLLTAWAKDPSSRNLIFGAVKSLLIPCFTEGSEEFVTEWAQQITDYLGQAHNKEEFKELAKDIKRKGIWKNILDQAMEAGIAGGLVGIGMAGKSTFDQANTIKNLQNASDYSRAAFNYYMRKAKEDRMPAKYATEEQRRQALKDYQEKGAPITFDEPTASDWYYSYVTRLSELEHQGIDLDTEGKDGDIYRKIRERFNAFVQTPEGKAVHDQIEAEYRQRLEQEAAQQAQQQPGEQPMAQPTPAEQQPTQALPAEVQPVETPAPLEQPKENKFPTKQKVDPKSQYSVDYKPGETKITDTNGEEAQVAVIGDKPQIRYFADEQSGVKGYWAFVSAKTLEVSKWLNNATQNRDMSTKQSRETVAAIKNGLKNNPSQTLDSRTVDHGAPTVIPVNDEKGNTHLQVHFGNHRAEATIEGYSDAEIAQALRTVATEHAQKNNIDISSIQDPILVFIESEAQTVEQVQQGTQRGNHTATRQMTPSQNAQSDALLLAQHPEVLKKFVPGGNLSTDNFDFLRDFMQITDTMNAGLLDEKNRPTMEAENRVARAMFAYFLRNESPERQERMLKSVIDNAGDNNIVSLVRGIMSNAPALAQLEEKFPDYALGKEMINALDSYLEYKRARSKGEFNNIENWFNQTTMDFGDKNQKKLDLNDVEKDLTRIFDKVKTIKGIRTFFNTFTDKVHEEAGGEGLFSDVQKRTKAEIIHDLAQKTLEPEEDTSGTTANASVENESTEHAPRVESARVADVTQEGQQATNEAVQEKRRNIDNAVKVAKRLFPGYTIHVHDTLTDIPREHKAQIPEDGIAQCYNDGNHGIHVIAENMPSDPATIRQIIMSHEIVGHDGLKQLLGNRYDKMLDSVYADHKNDIKPIAKLYGYNLNKVEELREATEEWLARNANIEDRPSWFNRLVAKIRATLRVMFNIKWSDNDIRSCFIEAARNLQEQSGSQHIRFAISDSQTTLDAAAKQLGIDLNAETQEFRDVFKQYYGTPQWMKAPNGKPTNLTARQWVQVRTPAFKRWFGNWEAEFEEQRMRNTVKEWLSNENIEKARGKLRSEIFEMFGNDLEAVAHIPIEYLPYLSDGIEDNRVYSGKGYLIDHAVNHHPEVEITSYGNIQNIIDTADDVKLDNKNPGRNPSILFIKQVDPTGVVVVSFDEGENGKIVLHKSFFEKTKKGRFDKLPSIKNGANASLMVGNPIISPAADATAAVRRISALNDNNTINHGNYFVKSDFSKIVDENGEPMVVYHGTEGSFTVFDKTKGRANMDIQGMFFSPWEDDARGYGSRLMPCFLNIRHPASEGQAYKALKAHQGENNAGVKAREDLIAQGFDGVNNENEEFIAFEPTQIKSATDNVGTFSNENPDIRFSLVSDAKVKEEFQDSDKYIETYRSAMLGEDGKLYPPMATKGGEGMELGQVYRSDERPELRNKKGKFPLKSDMRDSGKQGNVDAAYNPYFHSQPGVLNDQFSVAYDKSRMVTVKCRVLKSDIESGYWAEGAKDPVGYAEWGTSGPVTKQLRNRGGRTVILSRYIMPVEIVPDSEVARMIKEQIGDEDVTIPWNVVPPNLRNELAKTGVQVGTEEDFRQAEAEKNAKRKKNVLPTKGVRFSLIGEDGASQLDKSEGVTLRMDNLAIAKQMLQAKKGDLAIRLATGWERGADGKWRYEIDDSQVKLDNFGLAQFQRENPDYAWLRNIEDRIFAENYELTPDENKRYEELSKKYNGIEKRALDKIKSYMGTRLSAILDYPELYKAYPHFKYMSVFFVPNASYEGKYDGAAFYLAVDVANNELWSNAYVKSVLLHEIQHAIQQEEGFTRGSNPTKAGSTANYNRVAGEVESRNVERRMLLPTQKRRSTQLSATEDVPRHAQTTDFEYPIKLGGDIVDSAKLDKMFFTDHSLSEDEWDAYNKYISYGPVVGKAKLEAMLQSGIETFVESAKKQLPIFERIEGVEPIMKEDEHIRWSLQQAESAKKRLSELWENGNIRQDEVISIGNVEANVQEASKKLGLELPDNLSFIIRGGELQHLKNDHPELTSQDIERLVTAWINPDYLGLALGKNVKKMFLITQDDSSDAMGVIIIGLQKKQAHLKTFYIAERSKLLNSLKQKSTPLVEVAKSPADDSLNHPLQPTEGAVRNTNSEVPVNSNILPTKENASQEGEENKSGDGVANEAIRAYFNNKGEKITQNPNQLEFDFDYEQREETLSEGERSSQEDARRDATDVLRRCGGTLLGLGITKDFKSTGVATLVGRRITSPTDLADAAQIFRNPHFETFRYVFVKNNEVVYANAVTLRMPGAAKIFTGDNFSDFIHALDEEYIKAGADGYYLLHNHPSGNVTISGADYKSTRDIRTSLNGKFLGHVVINHNKYSLIDRYGNTQTNMSFMPRGKEAQYDPQRNPSLAHPMLGTQVKTNADIAVCARQIQQSNATANGSAVLFGMSPQLDIKCIATIPLDDLGQLSEGRIYAMTRQLGRISASSQFFLANVGSKYADYVLPAVRSGLLLDAVLPDGTSIRQQNQLYNVPGILGLKPKGKPAVTENTSDVNFSLTAEQPTPGNPDSVDQNIHADHVAKAVAKTPIENLRAMRLPLILELARKLKGDVKAVDGIPILGARGVFHHGSRLIEVLRELAKPQLLEKDIIVPQADAARQRQLWEDYWTKAGVPLNEIEIVETPVGGDVRMHAIRHDRTLARFRKTAAHEVGHLIDYNTGETTSHGNVLGTVGGMLKGWLMNVIGETPSTQVDKASLNQLRKQLHKQAETIVSQTTPKPKSTDKAALDAWRQAVSDKYHELFVDECDRNAWFRREVVREEMVDLTRWWSGEFFGLKPSYVEYRQKPTELFAETMSVLLNAPDELMKRSPETWRLIQNYQSNKPEFHKAWRQLMDLMNDETAYAKSLLEIQRRGFDAGEVAALAAIRNNPSFSFEDSWMAFKRRFVNKFANVADASKQVVRNGQMVFDDTPLAAVTAAQHASVKDYYMKMANRLAQPLLDMGLTEKDIGLYMQNKRIENDPSLNDTDRGILNPNGLTAEDATLALDELHRQLGDEKWNALEKWHRDFWQLRQETIIQMMEDSGAYSQELLDHVRDNEWYAYRKIISTLYGKDGAAHDNGSAKIYGLKGTVSDAANPLAWTFENDLRIMGGILWNTARMRTVDLMQQFFPNMIQKPGVEGRMTNGRLVMKDAPDGFTRMYVLREGKLEQWDVADAFAVGFSGVMDEDLRSLMSGLSKATNYFRMGWTTYSPTFFVNNVIRDYLSTYQNFTEKNSPGLLQWTKYWALGMKEAFGDEFGWTSAVIDEMERQNMFQSAQQGHGEIVRQGTELSRLMDKYQLFPTKTWKQRVVGWLKNPIKAVATLMEHLVSATERGAKAGGYLAMQDRMSGLSTDEMRYHVIKHIGSPDFATRGTKTFVTNTLFVFSNAAIQGWSATAESAKASPRAYGMRWMATTGVATLLTWAMSSGALLAALRGMGMDDDDDLIKFLEWMKKMYGKITHYNRFNYACLPIGETDDGQAVYIRIPYAENSRVSAMIFKGLLEEAYNETPKSYGAATETARAVGSMATNTNPIIAALLDLAMFGQGYNIYDRHYGRPKVKTEDFNAGGLWRAKGIGSYMYREYSPYNFMKWDPENPNFWYDLIGTTLGWGTLVRKSSAGEKEAKREKNQLQRQIKASQLINIRKKN